MVDRINASQNNNRAFQTLQLNFANVLMLFMFLIAFSINFWIIITQRAFYKKGAFNVATSCSLKP